MPIQQFFVEPNTGATLATSYIRVVDVQWDRSSSQVSLQIGRWASATTFSLGLAPVAKRDFNFSGAVFLNSFLPTLAAADASFRSSFVGAAEAFILGLPQFSGATQVP